VTDPPPLATANVTVTPLTGFPLASLIFTDGGFVTVEPTAADCPLDAAFDTAIPAAGPAMKFTVALLASAAPPTVAVMTDAPADVDEVSVAVYDPLL